MAVVAYVYLEKARPNYINRIIDFGVTMRMGEAKDGKYRS